MAITNNVAASIQCKPLSNEQRLPNINNITDTPHAE